MQLVERGVTWRWAGGNDCNGAGMSEPGLLGSVKDRPFLNCNEPGILWLVSGAVSLGYGERLTSRGFGSGL